MMQCFSYLRNMFPCILLVLLPSCSCLLVMVILAMVVAIRLAIIALRLKPTLNYKGLTSRFLPRGSAGNLIEVKTHMP